MAGKLFEYPFDTVKVRLQSQPDGAPLKFSGPLDCFRQTWHKEGVRGFYRGLSSPMVGAAAENAFLFLSYRTTQNTMRSLFFPYLGKTDALPMPALLVCGALSGTFTSFILTPIELIKCKMQVQNLVLYDGSERSHTLPTLATASSRSGIMTNVTTSRSSSPMPHTQRYIAMSVSPTRPAGAFALISQVYREGGILGFWRGQLGTLFRETGGSAAWFGAYEYVSSLIRRRRMSSDGSPASSNTLVESMAAGAVAGISYNLSLFPADSVKSRMQTESILAADGVDSGRGFWTVARDMYRSGGIRALYRGCGMTVMRAAPSSAIIFLTYEYLKSLDL
ncbi:mitochondrial carrier domain-containing protein [Lipomyces tetrasporus]|uniref:Mitochondrial carrier domain-containing protein n=1 Tax=Lipomyces tetrasporus TaxID=54092 RepID=A0AAD7QZD8_9ASCO|nr:mitochondrial carrier domain-containing protein [Lipomyces tetrasporus]KAJ8103731.1 mitochondrial carrier domain-containing protein [Lipomyces tetrasporus]